MTKARYQVDQFRGFKGSSSLKYTSKSGWREAVDPMVVAVALVRVCDIGSRVSCSASVSRSTVSARSSGASGFEEMLDRATDWRLDPISLSTISRWYVGSEALLGVEGGMAVV